MRGSALVTAKHRSVSARAHRHSVRHITSTRAYIPARTPTAHVPPLPRPFQARWQDLFDMFMEIYQSHDTHFNASTQATGRITRAFTAAPTWLLLQLGVKATRIGDPVALHQQCVSDHAPVTITFHVKPQLPPEQRPIPQCVAEHPRFPVVLHQMLHESDLEELALPLRHVRFKELMRQAARQVRNEILANASDDVQLKALQVASIARAVWYNDNALARTLLRRCDLARAHLDLSGHVVSLTDPVAFQTCYQDARKQFIDFRISRTQRELDLAPDRAGQLQLRRQQQVHCRLDRIWRPFGKKLTIHSVITPTRNLTAEQDKTSELAHHWAKVFSERKLFDHSLAHRFARKFAPRIPFDHFQPPTSAQIRAHLVRVRPSAPGVDGIPYSLWLAAGPEAWRHLFPVGVYLCSGFLMDTSFNDTLMIFAAKGTHPDDDMPR